MPKLPPPRASYRLTPLGYDLAVLLAALVVALPLVGLLYGWWVL